ncbi:MAG: hypothetical protein WAU25_11470 [Nitrososphaeraceae archaeon]
MENSLRRLLGDTLMDVMVDVPLVSSCRIMAGMAGMVKMIHMPAIKLLGALIALRYAGIDKNLIIQLNDSDATFDEIAVT